MSKTIVFCGVENTPVLASWIVETLLRITNMSKSWPHPYEETKSKGCIYVCITPYKKSTLYLSSFLRYSWLFVLKSHAKYHLHNLTHSGSEADSRLHITLGMPDFPELSQLKWMSKFVYYCKWLITYMSNNFMPQLVHSDQLFFRHVVFLKMLEKNYTWMG